MHCKHCKYCTDSCYFVHADDSDFKIDMVDRRFQTAKFPPVQPSNNGGGGGRSYDPEPFSPPPKKRQKLTDDDQALLDEM